MSREIYCQVSANKRIKMFYTAYILRDFAFYDLQVKRLLLPILKYSFFLVIVGILLVVGAENAEALRSKAFNPTAGIEPEGTKVYDDNTLDEKSIQRCLLLEAELEESENQLAEYQSILDKKNDERIMFESDMAKMKDDLAEIKKKGLNVQQEVDAYNKMADAYNARIPAYKTLTKEINEVEGQYNKKIENHNQNVAVFDEDCANKKYYRDDLRRVQGKLK